MDGRMSEFEDIARRMREIREQEGRAATLIEDAPKASIAIDQCADRFVELYAAQQAVRDAQKRLEEITHRASASVVIDQSAPAAPVELTDDDFIYGGGFCI